MPYYEETGLKYCKDCKLLLPTDDFPVSRRHKKRDGSISIILAARCRLCHNRKCVENQKKTRRIIVKHYSNNTFKCSECGESRYQCLDLDHIYNNGKEDRTTTNPYVLYRRLIKNGFPEGYQILCRNCNWIKYLSTI